MCGVVSLNFYSKTSFTFCSNKFDVDMDQFITVDPSMNKHCLTNKKKEAHRSQFKLVALYNKLIIINPRERFAILTSA